MAKKTILFNKHLSFIYFLLILFFFYCQTILANETKFEHISIDKGLSHSSVFTILQDSKGFMWFGTQNGLNKFDGYNFTVFKNEPSDSSSIANSTVFSIYEDSRENIWIGTLGGGLNKYDSRSETFTHYINDENNEKSLSNNNVRSILEDKEGNLWVGTNNGLNLFDRTTKTFKRFLNDPNNINSLSNNYVWSIFQDSRGAIWIGTYSGLNKLTYKNETAIFVRFTSTQESPNSISHNYIWSITEDKMKNLWIGTDDGLNKMNLDSNTFKPFYINDGLGRNKFWSLFNDENNDLWIGSLGEGLYKLDVNDKEGKFINFKNDIYNDYSLSHNNVWSIFKDRSGVLWIGTDIGLNKYDETRFKFNLTRNIPGNKNSLSSNEITAIFKDSFGYLWIGTRHGLNKYDAINNIFTHFNITDKNHRISDNYIRSIYEAPSEKGILWVGTNNGLNKINILSNKQKSFNNELGNPNSISNNNVTDIFEDSKHNLWIGTLGGLNIINRKAETFQTFLNNTAKSSISNNYIFAIKEDSAGNIWIATGLGLNKFDKTSGIFERFLSDKTKPNSISNNFISDLYFDRKGTLWIATNGGLNKFDDKSNSFSVFSEKNGLPSNSIVGIEEDDSGFLWLSTSNGLSKFDPIDLSFQNYSIGDGLQSSQFTGGVTYKSSNGEMFFGGINGLNSFYPNLITNNSKIPPVVITEFLIYNKSVPIGDDSQLKESIAFTSDIELSYADNYFSFRFAALHYSYPNENKYKYKMYGVDRDWVESDNQRFANYTNIDPGEYVFTVIGSNNDGVWNEDGASIKIIIHPPFWRTWWFILLAISALVSIIISIFHYRTKNLLAIERLRLKIAEDLHDDIGTRLTEISMLSDFVYHTQSINNDPNKTTIKSIGSIARQLIDNMSDIVWLINPKRDSLYELFLKLKDTYEEILSISNINFQINDFKFFEAIKLTIEVRKNIYLLFKEAINNSIKHSGCSEISINSQLRNKVLQVTLYDNGNGFDINNKSLLGNGLNNMKHRAEMIDGRLRINSSIGSGTVIEFKGKV